MLHIPNLSNKHMQIIKDEKICINIVLFNKSSFASTFDDEACHGAVHHSCIKSSTRNKNICSSIGKYFAKLVHDQLSYYHANQRRDTVK